MVFKTSLSQNITKLMLYLLQLCRHLAKPSKRHFKNNWFFCFKCH